MSENTHRYLPHPRPFFPYAMWGLSVFFYFYIYLVQFSTYSIAPSTTDQALNFPFYGLLLNPLTICIILFQIPIALLIDRYGPRKITSLTIVCFGLGCLLFGFAHERIVSWTAIFILGIGWSTALVTTLKLTFLWFIPKRFAVMVGLTLLAASLGASFGQPVSHFIIKAVGWRQMMIDFAIFSFVYALIFYIFIRDKEGGAQYTVHPKEEKPVPFKERLPEVFLKPHNWKVALFFGLSGAPWLAYYGVWQIPFLKKAFEVTERQAIELNVLNILLIGIGAPIFAFLSSRTHNRKRWMFWGTITVFVASLLLIYLPGITFTLAKVLSSISAFASSTWVLCYPLLIEKNRPQVAATAFGLLLLGHFVFRILFDLIFMVTLRTAGGAATTGLKTITTENYQVAFLVMPVLLIFALIALFFIQETQCKPRYK